MSKPLTTPFQQACMDYYLLTEQRKKLKIKIGEARKKCRELMPKP